MKTIKTISNISYNSNEYFEDRINNLVDRGIIDWCYWIEHQPDTDETKRHIHFVLKPSSRLDTKDLRDFFNEYDEKSNKPLTCTSKWFMTNSLDDWLLYAVHDVGYLASKGQSRNMHYLFDNLKSTDEDALRYDWNNINRTKYERLRFLADAVDTGVPFAVLVQNGIIPIALRSAYEFQYNALMRLAYDDECGRGIAHEIVDTQTGEITPLPSEMQASMLGFKQTDDVDF